MTASIEDATCAVDAATLLGLLPARPRLLAVGEPTHGEDVLLELRNDLFRQLVGEGYRTITIESDCLLGLIVDDYVTAGEGDLDDVMARGFSHGWGASAANRELVRWMRAYNAERPAAEQVRFAGFDGPLELAAAASPRQALMLLHGHLAARVDPDLLPCTAETLDQLLGADESWTELAAMRDPSRSVGRSVEAQQLRLLTDDLAALLATQAPELTDRALLYARTATGLLRYHAAMADPAPSRLNRMCALRDGMMAANLLATADRGPALVHAHNSHLQRELSTMQLGPHRLQWWSAGAIVSARLGQGYAFVPTALGTIRHHGVGTPAAETFEGLLYALAGDRQLVDTGRLAKMAPVARVSEWFGYAPLDPARITATEGILFVRGV